MSAAITLAVLTCAASVFPVVIDATHVRTAVFFSPPVILGPGMVGNKYFDIQFPKGHLAVKGFDAEVVDEEGNSVPLHQTYLHHWLVIKYYSLIETESSSLLPKTVYSRNSGVCPNTLTQFFGLGAETRRTATQVPDPYGIEIGNPRLVPDGYEEKWKLNLHIIDTRGVEDRMGCTECRCSLYNVTTKSKDYAGGILCCRDQAQCLLSKNDSALSYSTKKSATMVYYLRYKLTWVEWDDSVLPVKIFIFDATYTSTVVSKLSNGDSSGFCTVEYNVDACSGKSVVNHSCIHSKRSKVVMPQGGDVVYAVGHLHAAGLGSSLYGQDGRILCSSIPVYGKGDEAGNEGGYIVGMSTCYPTPGSVRIAAGETITMKSNYSSLNTHTGVMGLFYILLADPLPKSDQCKSSMQLHQILFYTTYSIVPFGNLLE